jgi:hypothetical protein
MARSPLVGVVVEAATLRVRASGVRVSCGELHCPAALENGGVGCTGGPTAEGGAVQERHRPVV